MPIELYSNRSAVLVPLNRYDEALADADRCIAVKPDWAKGHSRRANALHAMCKTGKDRWAETRKAYERALELDPNNETVKRALDGLSKDFSKGENASGQPPPAAPAPFKQEPVKQESAAAAPAPVKEEKPAPMEI